MLNQHTLLYEISVLLLRWSEGTELGNHKSNDRSQEVNNTEFDWYSHRHIFVSVKPEWSESFGKPYAQNRHILRCILSKNTIMNIFTNLIRRIPRLCSFVAFSGHGNASIALQRTVTRRSKAVDYLWPFGPFSQTKASILRA